MTFDTERINSQISLLCEKVITSVDPGWINNQHREDTERINSQLSLLCEKVITSVVPRGGSMIDTERISSQLSLFT